MQRVTIDAGVDVTCVEQCTNRGGEAQMSRRLGKVERLDAESVARQCHYLGIGVDDREREHALEVLDTADPPPVKSLEHHLAVSVREESIAGVSSCCP